MKSIAVVERALGFVASILLFAMMVLTVADVAGRYVFSSPLSGAFELTQILLAWLIFAALPAVSARDGHVSIGLLDRFFSGSRGRVVDVLIDLFGAGVSGVIAWRLWVLGARMAKYGDRFAFLPLPKAVVAYPMSLLAALTAVVLVMKATGLDSGARPSG